MAVRCVACTQNYAQRRIRAAHPNVLQVIRTMSFLPFGSLKNADADYQNGLLVTLLCALLVFISLGSAPVQPWDESLYALRARAVIEHNVWMDQTAYAAGGLYSSTYPPLAVWGMAISMKVLGQSPFAVRLFSALCSCIALGLLYGVARRMLPAPNAMLVPVLLGGAMVWNTYARMGMTDIPLMCFVLAALWSLLRAAEEKSTRGFLMWCAVYALAVAVALLTKITVSLLAVALVALPVISLVLHRSPERLLLYPDKIRFSMRRFIAVCVAACIGIALAAPWYSMMASIYGSTFTDALFAPHFSHIIEGASRSLGVLYYINQLIIAQPYIVLTFGWYAMALLNRRALFVQSRSSSVEILCALWFAAVLILFSIAPTKMPHYSLLMVVPAVLLASRVVMLLVTSFIANTVAVVSAALLTVVAGWSLSQELRTGVQMLFRGEFTPVALAFVAGAVALPLIAFLLREKIRIRLAPRLAALLLIGLPAALVLRVVYNNAVSPAYPLSYGAKETAVWLDDSPATRFVHLYHAHNPSDTLMPHLRWYLPGIGAGRYTIRHVALPLDSLNTAVIRSLDGYSQPVVYSATRNDTLTARVVHSLMHSTESGEGLLAAIERTPLRTLRLQTPGFVILQTGSAE